MGDGLRKIGVWGLLLLLFPWAALAAGRERITTWQQLEDYARQQAELRKTDFTFDYASSLALNQYTDQFSSLMQQSGMRRFQWEYTSSWIRVFNVEYEDEFAVCRTEGEIRGYLAWCAQYQVRDFALYVGESLYKKLKAGDFAGIHSLEGEARITNRKLSYSDGACAFFFRDVSYDTGADRLTSMEQVMHALRTAAESLQDSVNLFCSDSIYRQLTAGKTDLLHDMGSALGIDRYTYTLNDGAGRISLTGIQYRAGHRIYHAYRMGNYDLLSQREYDTLVYTINTLNGSGMPMDLLGAERWIHDFLCDRITYAIDDFSDEDDCAVGALLNGRANCDGYSDAFYLMGSLLGMEIRCQSGDALRTDGDAGHMWNLIRLNGNWYMVDVTWNDSDGGNPAHIWYNIGADFARYSHTWQDYAGLDPMAENTENGYRPYPIYRCYSFDDLKNIMADCKARGLAQADIFYGFGADLYQDTDRAYDVMRKAGVKGSIRSIWYDRPGFVHFYQLQY